MSLTSKLKALSGGMDFYMKSVHAVGLFCVVKKIRNFIHYTHIGGIFMKELNASEVFQKLGEPFSGDDIEWRSQLVNEGRNGYPPSALVVPYVQSRAIMNRLDEVVGWDRWENIVQELPGGGIIQGIRIWLSETRSITKWDGADKTNIEATKGGISSAFKRAAVLFSLGRHLYSETAQWVSITEKQSTPNDVYVSDKKKNIYGYFTPPSLEGESGKRKTEGKQDKPKEQSNPQNYTSIPQGMIECIFRGHIQHESPSGSSLEVWFEQNGDAAQFFAIGEMKDYLLSLNLKDGDSVAIATQTDNNGTYFINNVVKVA
jgi:hypothetical protein